MPIIPPETFKHLFDKTKAVDRCVKEALLCKETTMFVANGGAAGQQSNHFMLHIIPRESGDDIGMLDVGEKDAPDEDIKSVVEKIGPVLQAMLGRNLPALGFTSAAGSGAGSGSGGAGGGAQMPQTLTKEQALKLIETNPQLKTAILNQPEQFKQMVPTHPQLGQLFKDLDIDSLVDEVVKRSKPKKPGKLSLDEALK
jgi:hypothetical protein